MENNSKYGIQYNFLTEFSHSYTDDTVDYNKKFETCVIPSGIDLQYISFDPVATYELPGNCKYVVKTVATLLEAMNNMFVGKFPLYSCYVKQTNTGTGYLNIRILEKDLLFNEIEHKRYICLTCFVYNNVYSSDPYLECDCSRELHNVYCPKKFLIFDADEAAKINTLHKFIRFNALDSALRHVNPAHTTFQTVCEFTCKYTGLQFPFAV